MNILSPDPILPIACRFVSTDQWLTTHLDTAWSIAQVKQYLLGKFCPALANDFLPVNSRPVRRDRALSPITFSTHGHNEDDDAYNSDDTTQGDSQSDLDDLSDDLQNKYKYIPDTGSSAALLARNVPLNGPAARTKRAASYASHYTLLAFSTGQLLEDHFSFSWYSLRPDELLELYPSADSLVILPRAVPEAYIRPYYETKVRALRFVSPDFITEWVAELGQPHEGKSKNKGKGKERERRLGSGGGPASDDPTASDAFSGDGRKKEKKRRKRMEWRDRWVIIEQGVFKLCRDRHDPRPTHVAPLSALLSLAGGEQLQSHIVNVPSAFLPSLSTVSLPSSPTLPLPYLHMSPSDADATPADVTMRRVVCAKFRGGPHPPPHSPTSTHPAHFGRAGSRPNTRDGGGGWWRRGSRDASTGDASTLRKSSRGDSGEGTSSVHPGLGDDDSDEDAVWIVMDLLTETAHDNLLRILHRHSPHSCSSSFVPVITGPEPDYTFPSVRSINNSPGPSDSSQSTLHGQLDDALRLSITETVYPGGKSVPYPEWRLAIVRRARKAGLGAVSRAMELVTFGEDDIEEDSSEDSDFLRDSPDEKSSKDYLRLPRHSVPHAMKPPPRRQSEPHVSPVLWRGALDNDSDSESGDGSNSEHSTHEWESWIEDLSRQRRVQLDAEERPLSRYDRELQLMVDADEPVSASEPPSPWQGEKALDADDLFEDGGSPSDLAVGTGAENLRRPAQTRTLHSYSSVDSFIRRTLRSTASRARPRIAGSTLLQADAREPSPLSRMDPADVSQAGELAVVSSSSMHTPSIPLNMRMTELRPGSGDDESDVPWEASSITPLSSYQLGSKKEKGKGKAQATGTESDANSVHSGRVNLFLKPRRSLELRPSANSSSSRPLLGPIKLKLSLAPAPSAALDVPRSSPVASSPASIESMRFVTPDSD